MLYCEYIEMTIKESISVKRGDGRAFNQLRDVKITPGYLSFAEGSVLIEMGKTHVICAASSG